MKKIEYFKAFAGMRNSASENQHALLSEHELALVANNIDNNSSELFA